MTFGVWTVVTDRLRGWADVLGTWPVPSWALAVASLTGGAVVVTGAGLVWLVTCAAWLAWMGPGGHSLGTDWLLLGTPVIVYLLLFYGLGSAVAWYGATPLRSVTIAALAWVVTVMLLPQVVQTLRGALASVPPRADFEYVRQQAYSTGYRALEGELIDYVSARVVDHPSTAVRDKQAAKAFNEFEPRWRLGMAQLRSDNDSMTAQRLAEEEIVNRVASWTSHASAGMLLQNAMSEIGGTGPSVLARWDLAARTHHDELARVLFDDRPSVNFEIRFTATREMYAGRRRPAQRYGEMPRFEPPAISRSERFNASIRYLVSLTIHAALALALAFYANLRYWRYEGSSSSAAWSR